jgi:hypothetical protein
MHRGPELLSPTLDEPDICEKLPDPFPRMAEGLWRAGLAPIPVGGEDGKKPLVTSFTKWRHRPGLSTIRSWVAKFPDANVGIVTGSLSGVSVIDVDSADLMVQRRMIERFGDTPLKTHTPSGGCHLWYLHNAITRRTPAEARHTTYSYVPRMSRHSFKILTLPKRRLKLRRAERRVLRPGPSNAVWCRQLRWCRAKTKSPAGSFVGEKSAPACSEATGCTSLRWRSVTRAPPTRRTQEILARNRSVNLLGFRDAVTVELWNSRNRVQIDRPGREVFCRGEREQADTSAPSSRLSRVIPF